MPPPKVAALANAFIPAHATNVPQPVGDEFDQSRPGSRADQVDMALRSASRSARIIDAEACKRLAARKQMVAPATLWPANRPGRAGAGQRVWVYNISNGGIAFRADAPPPTAGVCFLKLHLGPLKLESPLRIAWHREADHATTAVGAAFVPES